MRRRRPLQDRIEEAALVGDAEKILKLARRFKRAKPSSADARFFEILALSRLGRHDDVIQAAAAARHRLPKPQLAGIAYLAVESAVTLDRHEEAREWIPLAAADPDIARRISTDPKVALFLEDVAYQ